MASPGNSAAARFGGGPLTALQVASAAVLAGSLLAGFRVGFADDVGMLLRANGARVLLAAGAGAALALSGSIRLARGGVRPLAELELFGLGTGAAAGGWLAAEQDPTIFVPGALIGAALGFGLARAVDRPRRWSNALAALLLGVFIAAAALVGTYARERADTAAAAVAWLLGDLSSAGALGSALVLAAAIALVAAASRGRGEAACWLALGLGIGAAGPLVLVSTFVPRTVHAWARNASPSALTATSALAGGASVAAIDAVPRLLVGGYALPFNVAAGMLMVPILLLWNRSRLRRELGKAHPALEAAEILGVLAATGVAAALAGFLTLVVRSAT